MSATFGGSTFGERPQGANFPRFGREADYTVIHIPGGNTTIIQSAGRTADKLTLEGYCSAAELTALIGKVDTVASLVYSGGTRSAYLAKVTAAEVYKSGNYNITLEFIGR